jgi:Proteasome complex subunit Rpn13 ubiquitin receptor
MELTRGSSDRLLHMKYKLRNLSAATLSDDVVFPNDISVKRIRTPKSTDRVYEIAFNNSPKRMYVWSQELDESSDEKNIKQILETINTAETSSLSRRPGLTANELERVMRSINFPRAEAATATASGSGSAVDSSAVTAAVPSPTDASSTNIPASVSSDLASIDARVASHGTSVAASDAAVTSTAPIETMDLDSIDDEELRRALEMSLADAADEDTAKKNEQDEENEEEK